MASASQIPKRNLGRQSRSPRPTGATLAVCSNGPMYLRHGFRRPNFVPKFGASVMVIGPYRKKSKPHQPPESAAHSGAFTARMGGNGWELRQRPSPRCPATPDNPSVMAFGHASSLYTREPLGTGDTDCRVASLLAMTVLILCHSEEAQRADVGIRSFLRWTGVRAAESSAPTGGCGKPPATAGAALSEAESAERAAGQIRFLPDDLRVQHGAQRSEVSAKLRPCSRRDCDN